MQSVVEHWIAKVFLLYFLSRFLRVCPNIEVFYSSIFIQFSCCNLSLHHPRLLVYLADKVGVSWTFITYGVACVLGTVFTILLVPETKGRTLEEINSSINSTYVTHHVTSRNVTPSIFILSPADSSNSYSLLSAPLTLRLTVTLTLAFILTLTEHILTTTAK